jgi:mannosyltransferase OCH1-like enzyme
MIPLILHQIWFQGIDNIIEPYKSCFIKNIKFLENTKWDHTFWDKERIENLILKYYPKYWDIYNNSNILVQKLDIARYIILYHYGGCYMDMDVELLKDISELIEENDELIVSITKQKFYNNSTLFSSVNNNFWLDYLNIIDINKFKFNSILNVNFSTGPFNFTYFIKKNIDKYNIKILDYKYLEPCETKYNKNITEEAYIINHFGNSWISPFYLFFIKLYHYRKYIYIILFCLIIINMLKSFSNRNKRYISFI